VLIAWCGGGVPERTKGYFTSHVAAVAKVLHGYHVQITARSDNDLAPESIMKKVADASGAKYTAGGSAPLTVGPPPVAKKPVFTPTTSSSAFNPLVAARNRKQDVDADGWGADAPPVTRTQVEKVESAYKPTKVNMAELTSQRPAPAPRFNESKKEEAGDLVKGGYQPVGKVDIAAIRAAAKNPKDDRPTLVKGAYEPVGKVDIAAIRARAQKPAEEEAPAPSAPSRSLAERSAAFSQPQSERLTTLPKPKVGNKFAGASSFTGTKAPTPGGLGFGGPSVPAAAPVGAASRTFADQGGKTPAQIWAEKKARQGGSSSTISPPVTSPITAQKSGEWRSGYQGKSWATVQPPSYSRGGIGEQKTGEDSHPTEEPTTPGSGSVSAIRDRFKNEQPMGQAAPSIPRGYTGGSDEAPPPPPGGRPSGGFQLPGLPSRPAPPEEEEDEEPEIPDRDESPPRVAVPVPRSREPEIEAPLERLPPRPIPVPEQLPQEDDLPEEEATHSHAPFGQDQAATGGGKRAVIQYDYEKAEDNEIELREGEYVTNIEMVDEDWWMGTNSAGASGLFPSNYVELVEDAGAGAPGGGAQAAIRPPPPPAEPEPEPEPVAPAAAGGSGSTAIAQFDYEAAEDNGMFPEDARCRCDFANKESRAELPRRSEGNESRVPRRRLVVRALQGTVGSLPGQLCYA